MRSLALVLLLSLHGCVISSRFIAGYGALAEAPGCGGVGSLVAVGIDGALAAAVLATSSDELTGADQLALGALGADVVIGGIMALQDCTD